ARQARRRGWLLVGASAASWGLGQMAWTVYEVGLDQAVPFPGWPDIGYLAAVPLAVLGILHFGAATKSPFARARASFDGMIVAYASGNLADGGWFVGYLLIAYAALVDRPSRQRSAVGHAGTLQLLFPYLPLAPAAGILAAEKLSGRSFDAVSQVVIVVLGFL